MGEEKPFYCIIDGEQEAYGETANLAPEFNIGLATIGYGYSREQAYESALRRLQWKMDAMRPRRTP